jgi:predicted metal-dependent hydrolase
MDYILQDKSRKMQIAVVRTNRKDIGFYISTDGIKLKVPRHLSDKAIISFCKENAHALFSHLDKVTEKYSISIGNKQDNYRDIYHNGAFIPLDDGQLQIMILNQSKVEAAEIKYHVTKEGIKQLIIKTMKDEPVFIRNCAVTWLKEYARYVLTRKVQEYAGIMGVTFGRISIREQKTRWGSCSSKSNLNFNWKLVPMPVLIQDYVVVHELAHLKEMNHSKAFWDEVEKVLPDYKSRIKWQRAHENEYFMY